MSYQVKPGNKIGRVFIRFLGRRLLYPSLTRPKISGWENIPPKSGYIIAFNHLSIFDPPFLVCYWPYAPEWIGAAEMFHEKDKSLLVRMYGGIPLDRDNYDRQAIEKAIEVLKSGFPLMVAPEMRITRTPGMRQARTGVAYLVQRTGVPVLPVGITGTSSTFLSDVVRLKRPRVTMSIGPLIQLDEIGVDRKQDMQKNADRIMANIARLLPEEYRGYYSNYEDYLSDGDLQ